MFSLEIFFNMLVQSFLLKKKTTSILFLISVFWLCSSAFAGYTVNISDIENLGSPFAKRYAKGEEVYARNIWDMQLYDGLIFLGAGNSSNQGPARNAGPVPIIFFDPEKGKFIREGIVNEEQIDLYCIINNRLYIPGHDPTESWALGNFYKRLDTGYWVKYRNIPKALHSYAMVLHNQKLFLGLGTKKGAAISVSDNNGKTWQNIPAGSNRVYSFLQVGRNLYATKKIKRKSYYEKNNYTGILEFREPDRLVPRPDLTDRVMFPGIRFTNWRPKKIVRTTPVGDKAIYIGAFTHNDHQYDPFGVFIVSSLDKNNVEIDRVDLPEQSRPWDILVRDSYIYILLSRKIDNRSVEIAVMRSAVSDLHRWKNLLKFTNSTFARSFEILNGDFYFGLGSEIKDSKNWQRDELNPYTGTILRIRKQYIKNDARD
jgi:hypothetical protein